MTRMSALCAALIAVFATTTHAGDRGSILTQLSENPDLSTLLTALEAADLDAVLGADGPFTIYAPTDMAFAEMDGGVLDILLRPENQDRLRDILLYHVDDRKLTTHRYVYGPEHYRPLLADTQHCITRTENVTIADGSGETATVIEANIKAANGVIHVIDKVLQPGTPPACHM